MAKPHNKKQPAIHDESPAIDGPSGIIGLGKMAMVITHQFQLHISGLVSRF